MAPEQKPQEKLSRRKSFGKTESKFIAKRRAYNPVFRPIVEEISQPGRRGTRRRIYNVLYSFHRRSPVLELPLKMSYLKPVARKRKAVQIHNVKNVEKLNALTGLQLKTLLRQNNINFKANPPKRELLREAIKLWNNMHIPGNQKKKQENNHPDPQQTSSKQPTEVVQTNSQRNGVVTRSGSKTW